MGTDLSSLRDNIARDRDADNSCFLVCSLVLSAVRSLIISPTLIFCPFSTFRSNITNTDIIFQPTMLCNIFLDRLLALSYKNNLI